MKSKHSCHLLLWMLLTQKKKNTRAVCEIIIEQQLYNYKNTCNLILTIELFETVNNLAHLLMESFVCGIFLKF